MEQKKHKPAGAHNVALFCQWLSNEHETSDLEAASGYGTSRRLTQQLESSSSDFTSSSTNLPTPVISRTRHTSHSLSVIVLSTHNSFSLTLDLSDSLCVFSITACHCQNHSTTAGLFGATSSASETDCLKGSLILVHQSSLLSLTSNMTEPEELEEDLFADL